MSDKKTKQKDPQVELNKMRERLMNSDSYQGKKFKSMTNIFGKKRR